MNTEKNCDIDEDFEPVRRKDIFLDCPPSLRQLQDNYFRNLELIQAKSEKGNYHKKEEFNSALIELMKDYNKKISQYFKTKVSGPNVEDTLDFEDRSVYASEEGFSTMLDRHNDTLGNYSKLNITKNLSIDPSLGDDYNVRKFIGVNTQFGFEDVLTTTIGVIREAYEVLDSPSVKKH